MSSLHREKGKPHWFCCFASGHGKQNKRSTKTGSKAQAQLLCQAMAKAGDLARRGVLNELRAAQIVQQAQQEFDLRWNNETIKAANGWDGLITQKDAHRVLERSVAK